MAERRYVLLDRDGTIIVEKEYLSDPAGVELLPGAAEGMRRMQRKGWGLVIVTNQSGIGRGYYSEKAYRRVTDRLRELLAAEGIAVSGIYHCPHAPEDNCRCRKPDTGMAQQAAADLAFTLENTVVIGDKPVDVELGRAIGARMSILVRTGYGRKHEAAGDCEPDCAADDLVAAAALLPEESNEE